jgi:hypothetical protein
MIGLAVHVFASPAPARLGPLAWCPRLADATVIYHLPL